MPCPDAYIYIPYLNQKVEESEFFPFFRIFLLIMLWFISKNANHSYLQRHQRKEHWQWRKNTRVIELSHRILNSNENCTKCYSTKLGNSYFTISRNQIHSLRNQDFQAYFKFLACVASRRIMETAKAQYNN